MSIAKADECHPAKAASLQQLASAPIRAFARTRAELFSQTKQVALLLIASIEINW